MHFPQYWPKSGGVKERSACFSARALKETRVSHSLGGLRGVNLALFTGQQPYLERPADDHFEQESL